MALVPIRNSAACNSLWPENHFGGAVTIGPIAPSGRRNFAGAQPKGAVKAAICTRALQTAEKLEIDPALKGHNFSRADSSRKTMGFSP
jgi:hypothetical protein